MVEWESVSANQQGGFQVFDTSLQSQPFGLKLKASRYIRHVASNTSSDEKPSAVQSAHFDVDGFVAHNSKINRNIQQKSRTRQ